MALLTKAAILAAADIQTEDVPVPEWGGTVRVRTISAAERLATNTAAIEQAKGDSTYFAAHLVAACIAGEDGQSEPWTADELRALTQRAAAPFERVFEAASRLNGFGAVEVAKGN